MFFGRPLLLTALFFTLPTLLSASPKAAVEDSTPGPAKTTAEDLNAMLQEDYTSKPFTTSPPPLKFDEEAVAPNEPAPKKGKTRAAKNSGTGPWWAEPFDYLKAFKDLKTVLVPEYVREKELKQLGLKAKVYFQHLQKKGYRRDAIAKLRSDYYTAVAGALMENGVMDRVIYYVELALILQPGNPEALTLKGKIKS